jgi:hypothetical protein
MGSAVKEEKEERKGRKRKADGEEGSVVADEEGTDGSVSG